MNPHPDPEINRKKDEALQHANETSIQAAELGAAWAAEHPEAVEVAETSLNLAMMVYL